MRRKALVLGVACAGMLTLAGPALAGNGGTLPLSPHSPNAHNTREAYIFVLLFTSIVFVGVEGALIVLMAKYRRGRRARSADGLQIHGSTRLEILWTVVPVLILAAIGAFVFYTLPSIANAPSASAATSTTIKVEGRQFYWMYHYPNGAVSIGTMVAPADNVVNEDVFAPDNDVLHSWWVPQLGGKIDAIPGHTNHTWFKAPVGSYDARCSDLCGIQHTLMLATVQVKPRADYEQFIADRAANPAGTDLGREEWVHVCAVCHKLNESSIGPSLGANPLLTHPARLAILLRNGFGKMPAVGSDWSDDQITGLVAYYKELVKGNG